MKKIISILYRKRINKKINDNNIIDFNDLYKNAITWRHKR